MRKTLLFSTLLLLVGCAGLRDLLNGAFKKPTLDFKRAEVTDVSLAGATVNLVYEVHNPNGIGLSLASVDYLFKVEGHQVVAGKPPNGLTIPANGTAKMVFPAQVRFADLGAVLSTFLTKNAARYEASGHLGVKTPIGVLTFPLSKKGQFPVPQIPAVAFKSPRVTDLSLSGATLEIPLMVTNHNGFPLPVSGLTGKIAIGGVPVGGVSTGALGSLASNQTREVTLPLKVNFTSATRSLVTALRGGSQKVTFDGGLQSGGAQVPVGVSQLLSIVH